jgi:hypothetical protein
MKRFALALALAAAGVAQVPDIYTEEVHGDPTSSDCELYLE